VRLSIMAFFLF